MNWSVNVQPQPPSAELLPYNIICTGDEITSNTILGIKTITPTVTRSHLDPVVISGSVFVKPPLTRPTESVVKHPVDKTKNIDKIITFMNSPHYNCYRKHYHPLEILLFIFFLLYSKFSQNST